MTEILEMMNHIEGRFDELDEGLDALIQQLREALDDMRDDLGSVRGGFRSLRTLTLALYASLVAGVVVVALMMVFFLTEHG